MTPSAACPGVKAYPSQANFILIELAEADPKAVFESLYRAGRPRAGRDVLSDAVAVPSRHRGQRGGERRRSWRALGTALVECQPGVTTGRA